MPLCTLFHTIPSSHLTVYPTPAADDDQIDGTYNKRFIELSNDGVFVRQYECQFCSSFGFTSVLAMGNLQID